MLGNFPASVRLLGVATPRPINTSRRIPNHQQFSLSLSPLTGFFAPRSILQLTALNLTIRFSALSPTREFSFTAMDEREVVSTDLKLGLSTSSFDDNGVSASLRQQPSNDLQDRPSLFIKVFMDGIPIGRKVNVFAQNEYDSLIRTINLMFPTTNIYSGADRIHSEKYHVLIYEDMEGDWLMVGDVPWEIFLSNVKRLKVQKPELPLLPFLCHKHDNIG